MEKFFSSRLVIRSITLFLLATLLLPVGGAGAAPLPDDPSVGDAGGGLDSQAGYYELEPIRYSFQNQGPKLEFTTNRARVFYSFHPADRFAERKPVFIFFNGGPGCPTSDYFLAYNTSPYTMDKNRTGGNQIKENPFSWTQMGNLLYIDAPNAGFSYLLSDRPVDDKHRNAAFGVQNFNPFIDAAQLTRVVLRFLNDHPDIQNNPVIFVGESYAGVRVSVMLNLLLYYPEYGAGVKIFRDEALANEIQVHFDHQFPGSAGKPFSPETIARQFGRQILIEPELTGKYATELEGQMLEAKDSPIHKFAAEIKKKYVTCAEGAPGLAGRPCHATLNAMFFIYSNGRDPYAINKPITFAKSVDESIGEGLQNADILSKIVGQDVRSIEYFAAQERGDAFRYQTNKEEDTKFDPTDIIPPDNIPSLKGGSGWLWCAGSAINTPKAFVNSPLEVSAGGDSLENVLGSLQTWDDYFVDCSHSIYMTYFSNEAIKAGYKIDPESPIYGEMFLNNLPLVETFLSDAPQDLAIYAAAIPPSFKKYTNIVADVQTTPGSDKNRDGFIIVSYKTDALKDVPTPESRTIYFPYYGKSGHSVSLFQPEELFKDVKEWMTWVKE